MFTRRAMLKGTSAGFGYLAFAALANEQATHAADGTATVVVPPW